MQAMKRRSVHGNVLRRLPGELVLTAWLCLGAAVLPAGAAGNDAGRAAAPGEDTSRPAAPARGPLPQGECASGSGARPPAIPPRLGLLLNEAQKKIESGDSAEAVRLLTDYVRKHPRRDHGVLEFMLGNGLYAASRRDEALDAYWKAVQLEPCYGPAWVNLGQVALEREAYPLAAEALERGYRLTGRKDPELLYHAGVARVLEGRFDRALPLLEPLLAANPPNLDWARTLLHVYMELGRNDRAAALLERLLSAYPEDPEVWRYAYRFEANRHRYERAVVALTILGYLTPLDRDELLLLGDLYAAVDVPRAAAERYEAALREGASVPEIERLALSYMAAHQPAEARATLKHALQKAPSPKLWMLLGELYAMEESYPEALEAFRESARLDAGQGRSYLMMGYCALQLGRKAEAVEALRKAVRYPRQEDDARQLLRQIEQGAG